MAGSRVGFASQVSEFVRASDARMLAVFRESAQRVIEKMQTPVGAGGNMPVDTGFLRASLRVTRDRPLPLSPLSPNAGTAYAYDAGAVSLTILGAQVGDVLFASYTANYALVVHYGREGRPGRQWVTLAAMAWPQVVAAVCAEVRAGAGGQEL